MAYTRIRNNHIGTQISACYGTYILNSTQRHKIIPVTPTCSSSKNKGESDLTSFADVDSSKQPSCIPLHLMVGYRIVAVTKPYDVILHNEGGASSMPPLPLLPLFMVCDDSDGCVTMVIDSWAILARQHMNVFAATAVENCLCEMAYAVDSHMLYLPNENCNKPSLIGSSMPPLISLLLSMACDDSDGCVTMLIDSYAILAGQHAFVFTAIVDLSIGGK
nr:hypothetical protein [Tanacetum cinerariifolium]